MTEIPGLDGVERVQLSEVTPAEDNPRKINDAAIDAVARSLSRFGWQQPIVVDQNGIIIVGHTRRLAALKLGAKDAPVVRASHLTPEEVKAYRIADNRSGEYSRWAYDALAQQLSEVDSSLAEVLGVSDWGSVMAGLEAVQAEAVEIGGLSEETESRLKFSVEYTVTFDSREAAAEAVEALTGLAGTCDIREKR